MSQKMTEESYIIVYSMILQSKIGKKNEWKNDWREYIRLYSIIYSQNLTQKMNKKNEWKNDWEIVYKTIYYDFEWKISKKND